MFGVFLILLLSFNFTTVLGLREGRLRIVQGSEANDKSHPYFVQILNSYYTNFICGGTLVSKNGVITAAACCQVPLQYLKLKMGSVFFNDGDSYAVRDIAIFAYREYFQLGIIIAEEFIKLKPSIRIMNNLISPNFDYYAELVVGSIAGFGETEKEHLHSKRLMQKDVRVISYDHCRTAFEDNDVGSNSYCTIPEEGDYDVCVGDLGGPMIYNNTLIGVIQNDTACFHLGHAAVYSKTGSYFDWIHYTLFHEVVKHGQSSFPDERHVDAQLTQSLEAFLFCVEPCNTTEASCVFHPLNVFEFLTTKACIEDTYSGLGSENDKTDRQISYKSQLFKIKQIIRGYDVIKISENSPYDLVLVRLSDPLDLPINYVKLKVLLSNRYLLPLKGFLNKYSHQQNSSTLLSYQIPVFNIPPRDCMAYTVEARPPFALLPEMFCVIPASKRSEEKFNLCSELNGASIYSRKDQLIGIVVWQKNCQEHKPIVAIRVSKLMKAFNSEDI